jgi:micrococcal nuclease
MMTTSRCSVVHAKLSLLLVLGACAHPPQQAPIGSKLLSHPTPAVTLDGKMIPVNWDDGDTFSTPDRSLRARLVGYNTLESYGPVHRWGEWSPVELFALAEDAGVRARSQVWSCTKQAGGGGYGRASVDCPGLRTALLQEGLAHTFGVEGTASPADTATQAKAMAAKAGMWAKGIPEGIVTSAHSIDERAEASSTYDRVCSTSTGLAAKIEHTQTHAPCTEVCHQGSCLLYVPYAQRYGENQADCLRVSAAATPAQD